MMIGIRMLLLMTVLTGFVYPLAITGLAQLMFPAKANGSRIIDNGRVMGSELIGQQFDDPKQFWSRLSATGPFPYNAASSSGSNYGLGNPDLKKALEARRTALLTADPGNTQPIPADLLTASASGLDPHISPESALYQADRVARLRGLPSDKVRSLVAQHTESRQLGFFGEPVVNVVLLNRALNGLQK